MWPLFISPFNLNRSSFNSQRSLTSEPQNFRTSEQNLPSLLVQL